MNFNSLCNAFLDWGFYLPPAHYVGFKKYIETMVHRNRLIAIEDENGLCAIITFFLTNDYETFYKKGLWDTPLDDDNGTQIYVDKMVCSKYSKDLRNALKETIEELFPLVEIGVYHRAPKDRCVKIYRRRTHAVQG